jgi:hypothetical protein
LSKQEKAVDDRLTALAVAKQRGQIAESRKTLAAAMAPLGGKGASDVQFEAAERAAAEVAKLIEGGKELEVKDKAYQSEAEKIRGELAQAKKRVDELFSATGVERLKAEIEPAHKDLVAAGKPVRARKPTQEQLAEARTAALVVRGLLEKFQPQAARSQAFGQYLVEVKKTLVEVEVELQKRTLDAARMDLLQALRALERKAPTDEQFQEASTALTILEKTLETVHAKDPALAPTVVEAKALVRAAGPDMAKRRQQVDIQRHRAKVEDAKRHANAAVAQIQQKDVGNDQLQAAENAIKLLRAVVEEGAPLVKKDRDYAAYDKDVKDRATQLTDRIAARRVALAAAEGRTQLIEAMGIARVKLEVAKLPEATDADVDALTKAVEALNQILETRAELERKDVGYAANAERGRNELFRLAEALEFAREARGIRRRTGEALAAGNSAADAGASARELRAQRQHFEKAIAEFRSCESNGASALKENRSLTNVVVLVGGQQSTPKDVIALCSQRLQATEQSLTQVQGLISFEEGPKRAYEAAKALHSRSKQKEAEAQYDECIASGLMLQNRNPELKDRKFDVAGSKLTLSEVVNHCISQRKALRGK